MNLGMISLRCHTIYIRVLSSENYLQVKIDVYCIRPSPYANYTIKTVLGSVCTQAETVSVADIAAICGDCHGSHRKQTRASVGIYETEIHPDEDD